MDISDEDVININRNEVEKIYTRGMGSGGQHKNVTNSCVILKHTPTGLQARIDGRVQKQNEKLAWKILEQRVLNFYKNIKDKEIRNDKMSQINNLRIRTYKVKDDLVIDHRHNRRCSLKQIYKGKLELLKE